MWPQYEMAKSSRCSRMGHVIECESLNFLWISIHFYGLTAIIQYIKAALTFPVRRNETLVITRPTHTCFFPKAETELNLKLKPKTENRKPKTPNPNPKAGGLRRKVR